MNNNLRLSSSLAKHVEKLEEQIAQLQSENERLRYNHLGVLTRQGALIENERIEHNKTYVVMLDINYLHQLNEKHGGQEQVDELMRKAFSIRSNDLLFKFNFSSGDEYGFVVKGNPEKFIERMNKALDKNGLSAMMAYDSFNRGDNLITVCANVMKKVYQMKKARKIKSR